MYRWIKLSAEAQSAARWQAKRGYDGSDGTPLPEGLSVSAFKEITENKKWFKLAVHMMKTSK